MAVERLEERFPSDDGAAVSSERVPEIQSAISADGSVKVPTYISPKIIRELSQLSPMISIGFIVLEWLSIILAILLSVRIHHIAIYIPCVIWIGSRMLALGIIMHDGAHYRLLKRKRWNDVISILFIAWPLGVDLVIYRRIHFLHHRYVCTSQDPDIAYKARWDDWNFPMRWQKLATVFIMSMSGIDIVKRLRQLSRYLTEPGKKRVVILRVIFYLIVAALLTYFNLWILFLLYWIVPFLTWLNFSSRLREIAEHSAIPGRNGFLATRTYFVSLLGRLFLAPNNVNYHIEHHISPAVPFYRLAKFHARLMTSDDFRNDSHFTWGFRGLLRECVGLS